MPGTTSRAKAMPILACNITGIKTLYKKINFLNLFFKKCFHFSENGKMDSPEREFCLGLSSIADIYEQKSHLDLVM